MSKKCFIIQPLDKKYKGRCEDIYKPSIKNAELEPYRVDEHFHATKLKIDIIKDEIKNSAVCLAEISEDNPNVWYELGFAEGHNIPVVLMCEKVRREKLPFDVNQRDVYFYGTEQDDWTKLQEEITKRLKIALEQCPSKDGAEAVSEPSIPQSDSLGELGKVELFVLWALRYEVYADVQWEDPDILRGRVAATFGAEEAIDAIDQLEARGMIEKAGSPIDCYRPYFLTDQGKNWCLNNKNLVRSAKL